MSKFLKEYEETNLERKKFSAMEICYLAVSAGLILFVLLRALYLSTDTTLIAYRAPDMREMGAPIKLERVEKIAPEKIQNMLYDFVRLYVRALYPKNSIEAPDHYRYVVRHTRDRKIKNEYLAYLSDVEAVGRELDNGKTTEFSPLNSLDVRMRKIDDERSWVVEIDGFLNNRVSKMEEDRGVVTLRFEISYERPSLEGSFSGWYVDDFSILHIKDAVANNVENVKAN